VYCFEPSRHNWPALESIGDGRVHLVKLALSDRVGEAVLHSDGPGSELASLTKRDLALINIAFDHRETVATSTIDEFMREERISTLDYLKLDVEGHELMALTSAQQALRERRIRALAFEFGGCNIDTRVFFRDFWRLLTGHQYRIFRIAPFGRLWPIAQYSEIAECFQFSNYLAIL
jgi:FkbM family methyltransferase